MNRTLIKFLATSATYFALDDAYAVDAATMVNAEARMLAERYADFAGSTENAASLVVGLRTGSPVTLRDGKVSFVFMPWDGGTSWDSVARMLHLARLVLAVRGIEKPAPEDLVAIFAGKWIGADGQERHRLARPASRPPLGARHYAAEGDHARSRRAHA